jgi:hypothetical protein
MEQEMQQSLGAEQFAVSNKAYSCVHWNSHAEATHFFATAFPRVARFIVPSVSGSFLYTNRVLEKLVLVRSVGYLLFLQEQIKDIIIIISLSVPSRPSLS